MPLNVKNKIWLGTLFLFALLVITGGASIYFISKMKAEATNILHDNYKSLAYGHTMQQQLNTFESGYQHSVGEFENALKQQENNVTEPGEMKQTNSVRLFFERFKKGDTAFKVFQSFCHLVKSIGQLSKLIFIINMNTVFIIFFTDLFDGIIQLTDGVSDHRRKIENEGKCNNKYDHCQCHNQRQSLFSRFFRFIVFCLNGLHV